MLYDFSKTTTASIRTTLRDVRKEFRNNGGRGVDNADYIDSASKELRRRRNERCKNKKSNKT